MFRIIVEGGQGWSRMVKDGQRCSRIFEGGLGWSNKVKKGGQGW